MKYLSIVFGFACLILIASDAGATMRCGSDLVSNGATKLDVIAKCGAPDLKESVALNTVGIDSRRAFRASSAKVEAWHYNCGEGRFNKTLYFDGGTLVLIKMSNSRGNGPARCN